MNTASITVSEPKAGNTLLPALRANAHVQEWMTLFHRSTGLAIRLIAADLDLGHGQAVGHEYEFCEQAGIKGSPVCCQTRKTLYNKLKSNLVPQLVVCATGFTEVAVPVIARGKHVATFLVGQTFTEKPDVRAWDRLAAVMGKGFDKKQITGLRSAYLSGHVLPQETLSMLIHMVSLQACRLVDEVKPAKPAGARQTKRTPATARRQLAKRARK